MEVTGKVYKVSKSYSTNGNPKYLCIIIEDNGTHTVFRTKPNSSFANYIVDGKTITVSLKMNLKTGFFLENIVES